MTPEHIDTSIARALKGESGLDPEVLKIHGFSTKVMRHLFSNLCHLEDATYLECGVFCGATLLAAFNGNPIHAIGIENFAQDFSRPNVREELCANIAEWVPRSLTSKTFTFIEADCFNITPETMFDKFPRRPVDIYFFDGEHSSASQEQALPKFFDLLADTFLFIVDDFSWPAVSLGTQRGIKSLAGRMKIQQEWHLSDHRPDGPRWHNDVKLYLCEKIK